MRIVFHSETQIRVIPLKVVPSTFYTFLFVHRSEVLRISHPSFFYQQGGARNFDHFESSTVSERIEISELCSRRKLRLAIKFLSTELNSFF